jgi:hypothetical protein
MRKTILLLAFLLWAPSMRAGAGEHLSLQIRVANGQALGSLHNLTANEVGAIRSFGWWEFTTVLYHDGQRWNEAMLRKGTRAVRGVFFGLTIKPGRPYSFTLDLSEYELPERLSKVTKVRVITCDLWSGVEHIRNPDRQLKPTNQGAP